MCARLGIIPKAARAIRRQIARRALRGQLARDHARLRDVDDGVERVLVINRGLVGMAAESEITSRIGPVGDLTRRVIQKVQSPDLRGYGAHELGRMRTKFTHEI